MNWDNLIKSYADTLLLYARQWVISHADAEGCNTFSW